MKHKTATATSMAATVGACALAFAIPAHADRQPADGGSATYQCQGDYDAEAAPTPVRFALLSMPTSVRPGDALSLNGVLRMTLSDEDAQRSKAVLSRNANIDATDFNVVVKAGGKTFDVKPTLVVSRPKPIASPFTLDADVSYPEVTIPAAATGAVTVTMPQKRGSKTEVTGAPDKVTFTAHLKQDSPLVKGRHFACWVDRLGSRATIARIPLTPPSDADPAPGPSAPTDAPDGAAPSSDLPAPPPAAPAPVEEPPAAEADVVPPATRTAAGPAGSTRTDASLASAPIPAATVSDQTFIPGWVLALFIAIPPAAAVAYAVIARRRLRLFGVTTTATR